MKISCLAAFVALSLCVIAPSVASADIEWELHLALAEGVPEGAGPWAKVTIEDQGDVDGSVDGFNDVKFTLELFLNGADEFVSRWMFNLDPTLDPDDLFDTYVSGDQPDNATFVTNEDSVNADGQGKADWEWQWPTANSDDRFEGTEMVMYYVSHSGQNLTSADFDFFTTTSTFANTVARVQAIEGDVGSAWIANPEPSSMLLAAMGLGGLGLTRVRRRKLLPKAA